MQLTISRAVVDDGVLIFLFKHLLLESASLKPLTFKINIRVASNIIIYYGNISSTLFRSTTPPNTITIHLAYYSSIHFFARSSRSSSQMCQDSTAPDIVRNVSFRDFSPFTPPQLFHTRYIKLTIPTTPLRIRPFSDTRN